MAIISEYVGFTQSAIALIERLRQSSEETREDIVVRSLSQLIDPPSRSSSVPVGARLGQGVDLYVGERPVLFFSKDAKDANKPAAVAEVRKDGFYLDGVKVPNCRLGNPLDPAMKLVQKRTGDLKDEGKVKTRSAWRQWHVLRQGRLVSLEDLQDPRLRRRRGGKPKRSLESPVSAEELIA